MILILLMIFPDECALTQDQEHDQWYEQEESAGVRPIVIEPIFTISK
jgi:hypothetical protein